ncbi:MAG: TIM barrel protein [Gemmatimonadota bacterium]
MSSNPPASSPPSALSRRGFVGTVAGTIATVALGKGALVGTAGAAEAPARTSAAPAVYPIGIELYAVRRELARDLPDTLDTVAKIGYEVVEFYAPYLDWTIPFAKEVRTQLDDLGMRCYSTHNSIAALTPGETMTKAIDINQILGARHIILASAPSGTEGLEGWTRLSAQLAAASQQLEPLGLFAGYHNHAAEWHTVEGNTRIMDVIAANTPANFVLQLDVGTCVEAGADPVAWIRGHPGRIRSLHLKDWAPGTAEEEKGFRVLFREGVSPWKKVLAAAESVGGVEFYLMEQEGSRFTEYETARRCFDSWRDLRRST